MIIGNGIIANSFKPYSNLLDGVIIFASGVSNSNEKDINNFTREKQLLLKTISENKKIKLIYFSSILVNFNKNLYYTHKLEMEELIKLNCDNYIIYRLPQIIGKYGNKNNIFNHIVSSITNNTPISIFTETERAMVDVDDLVQFVLYSKNLILNLTINFSYVEKILVSDLYDKVSNILNKHTFVSYISDENIDNWDLDNSKIVDTWLKGINRSNYTDMVIKKYIKNDNINGVL